MHQLHRRGNRENRRGGRRRLGYANVVSTLALVLAIGGGTAWAAHHYLITSTSQIKPSVLKKLHGANGKNGTSGNNGANGTNGTNGTNGANGAVAGYSATGGNNIAVPIGANTGNFVTVVSKSLPAGNYIVTSHAQLNAGSTAEPADPLVEDECDLFAGTTDVAADQTADAIEEGSFIVNIFFETSAIPVEAAVSLTATTTVSLQCKLNLPLQAQQAAGFSNAASASELTAVQTSTNS
jgi:hypothetical protein